MPKWQQGETQALGTKEAMERVPLAGATQNLGGKRKTETVQLQVTLKNGLRCSENQSHLN